MKQDTKRIFSLLFDRLESLGYRLVYVLKGKSARFRSGDAARLVVKLKNGFLVSIIIHDAKVEDGPLFDVSLVSRIGDGKFAIVEDSLNADYETMPVVVGVLESVEKRPAKKNYLLELALKKRGHGKVRRLKL